MIFDLLIAFAIGFVISIYLWPWLRAKINGSQVEANHLHARARRVAGVTVTAPPPTIAGKVAGTAGIGTAAATLAALLIGHWEGEDPVAKHNAFDPKGVITVCDGVTNYDWPWLKIGMKFTHDQCQKALVDLVPKYAAPIQKCVPGLYAMPPHRQAALISFAYNLGPKRICDSTISKYLNAGNVTAACDEMTQYIKANGHALQGLVNRREDPIWGEEPWCLRND
jgi:lysozyme